MNDSRNKHHCLLLALLLSLPVLPPATNRGAAPVPDRRKYRFVCEPLEVAFLEPGGKYVAGNLDEKGNFVPDPNATHAKALVAFLKFQGISLDPKILEDAKGAILFSGAATTDPKKFPCYEFRSGYLIEGCVVESGFLPKVGSKVITMQEYLSNYRPIPVLGPDSPAEEGEKINRQIRDGKLSLPIYNLPGRIEEVKADEKKTEK
jgi:hypothetical protein